MKVKALGLGGSRLRMMNVSELGAFEVEDLH